MTARPSPEGSRLRQWPRRTPRIHSPTAQPNRAHLSAEGTEQPTDEAALHQRRGSGLRSSLPTLRRIRLGEGRSLTTTLMIETRSTTEALLALLFKGCLFGFSPFPGGQPSEQGFAVGAALVESRGLEYRSARGEGPWTALSGLFFHRPCSPMRAS